MGFDLGEDNGSEAKAFREGESGKKGQRKVAYLQAVTTFLYNLGEDPLKVLQRAWHRDA